MPGQGRLEPAEGQPEQRRGTEPAETRDGPPSS
jgi:hypothetical protein